MEEPITFDVWGVPNIDGRPELVLSLTSAFPLMTRTAVLLAVNKSVRERTPMLLAEKLGWQAATDARGALVPFADDVEVFQAGWTPNELSRMAWCATHKLHFGGCLGCHVCRGFFRP